jgi:hypothetical protein
VDSSESLAVHKEKEEKPKKRKKKGQVSTQYIIKGAGWGQVGV